MQVVGDNDHFDIRQHSAFCSAHKSQMHCQCLKAMEENKTKQHSSAAAAKHAVKVSSTKLKFSKKAPSTPKKGSTGSSNQVSPGMRRSGNLITTCKTLSGDIVATFRNAAGKSACIRPMIAWLNEHEDAKTDSFAVHHIVCEADPESINFHREDVNSRTGKTAWCPVFVSIVQDEDVERNNVANRTKFAQFIMDLNNSVAIQCQCECGGTKLHHNGDTTPANEKECQTLHSIIGPRQTMAIMKDTFRDEDGVDLSVQALLAQDDLLKLCFPLDHIPKLKQQFGFPIKDDDSGTDDGDGIVLPNFSLI